MNLIMSSNAFAMSVWNCKLAFQNSKSRFKTVNLIDRKRELPNRPHRSNVRFRSAFLYRRAEPGDADRPSPIGPKRLLQSLSPGTTPPVLGLRSFRSYPALESNWLGVHAPVLLPDPGLTIRVAKSYSSSRVRTSPVALIDEVNIK